MVEARKSKWIKVQAYKHDGKIHREWSPSFIVEENDEYWAIASRMSSVTEADGRRWVTKEPAIFILFKKKWMNAIAMFKKDWGICYYVNIASPTILDDGYLKYIDYDLDVKLDPDNVEKMLDEKEFQFNAKHYNYSEKLKEKIVSSKEKVLEMIENKELPFRDEFIQKLFAKFEEMNQPIAKRV